jgi:tetratricopeptide (TPR) repeat protein
VHNQVHRRPPLPTRLTTAERDFYLQLRRLVGAAGLSCRALEESTSTTRSETDESIFFSKSQWGRWLNATAQPPRKAVRKLSEKLAKEDVDAGQLVELWDKAFVPGAAAPRDAPRSGQVRPRQLPISVQQFIGRAAQLSTLSRLTETGTGGDGTAVIVIEGTAGVGKTTLANRFAHRVSDRFPDGQLYANMRGFDHAMGPITASEALASFLDALGVAPNTAGVSVDGRAALYRSALAGKRVLVVIDNASDAEQVRPLLPGSPGSLVLVTSRCKLAGLAAQGARQLRLDPFTADEARELLNRRLGAERVAREPHAAAELIELCAGLPLALSVAAAHSAAHPDFPLAALTSEFRSRGLDLLDTGDPATTTRTVFEHSYRHLSDAAARLFRLLGIHPGPDISVAAAASLSAAPAGQIRPAFDELTREHLVEEHQPGRFAFHGLLRAYAAEQAERLDSAEDRRLAAHRVLDHHLHTATSASATLAPFLLPWQADTPRPGVAPERFSDSQHAVAWFDAEAPVLLALIGFADANGFDEHARLLPWTLSAYFSRVGRWQDWVATQRIALAAAERLGDDVAQAHSRYQLGYALTYMGDNDAAGPNLERALELFRKLGDFSHEAMVLNRVAVMLEAQGRYAEALDVALDGLDIVKANGRWWLQGMLENNIGWMYAHLGQLAPALAHCEEAVALNRRSGNRVNLGAALDSIGYIHLQLQDFGRSKAYYLKAIEVQRDLSLPTEEARSLAALADTLAASGDLAGATQARLRAVPVLERFSHPLAREVRAKLDPP